MTSRRRRTLSFIQNLFRNIFDDHSDAIIRLGVRKSRFRSVGIIRQLHLADELEAEFAEYAECGLGGRIALDEAKAPINRQPDRLFRQSSGQSAAAVLRPDAQEAEL